MRIFLILVLGCITSCTDLPISEEEHLVRSLAIEREQDNLYCSGADLYILNYPNVYNGEKVKSVFVTAINNKLRFEFSVEVVKGTKSYFCLSEEYFFDTEVRVEYGYALCSEAIFVLRSSLSGQIEEGNAVLTYGCGVQ